MKIVANKTSASVSVSELPAIEAIPEDANLSMKLLAAKVNEMVARVNAISNRPTRDRGPKSTRTMERSDAWRARFGDLKDASHKAAAEALGLSYGQVYSARNGFTLKDVTADEFSVVDEEAEARREQLKEGGLWDDDPADEAAIESLADELDQDIEEPTDEELAKLIADEA